MIKEREANIRVHQLIQELVKKQSFKRTTIISAFGVTYSLTHWGDNRWELVKYGIYEVGTKSLLQLLNATPDIVFLVLKELQGIVPKEDVLGLITRAKVLLHTS